MKSMFFMACLMVAGFASATEMANLQIDRQKLMQVADTLELTNLLQQESRMYSKKPVKELATPSDIQEGKFEIKCSTSCDFVPVGNGGDDVMLHQTRDSYAEVAEALAKSQERLLSAQKALEAEPDNEFTMKAVKFAEEEVQRKTFALQAVVGGRVPAALAGDATKALKKDLSRVQAELMAAPEDEVLLKQRDDLEAAINGIAKSPEADAASQLAELKLKYDMLKGKLTETPDDAAVNAELSQVETAIAKATEEQDGTKETLSPKKECYRVCVDPHIPENAGADEVDNCVRMCVKVMRSLVYNMATKFF